MSNKYATPQNKKKRRLIQPPLTNPICSIQKKLMEKNPKDGDNSPIPSHPSIQKNCLLRQVQFRRDGKNAAERGKKCRILRKNCCTGLTE
jgi:hypothetical protein